MEKMVTIDVWSDEFDMATLINIIHDAGIKTDGMTREIIGVYEEDVEWKRCKEHEIGAMVIDLIHDDDNGCYWHDVDSVEEKPLYLYKLNIVEEEENSMAHDIGKEEEVNVVMNIGLTTKDGKDLDMDKVVNIIGSFADCTITPTIGFYKGKRENSIKVEIYGYHATAAFTLAAHFARAFAQECVALTVNGYTAFIPQQPTTKEYKEFVARV
nr:MAG TPA: hypothetical protein [Caudoviricetes sp.]